MNYRPRSSASGDSSSGPQHLGTDSFDCCRERYEIVVKYDILHILPHISSRPTSAFGPQDGMGVSGRYGYDMNKSCRRTA